MKVKKAKAVLMIAGSVTTSRLGRDEKHVIGEYTNVHGKRCQLQLVTTSNEDEFTHANPSFACVEEIPTLH